MRKYLGLALAVLLGLVPLRAQILQQIVVNTASPSGSFSPAYVSSGTPCQTGGASCTSTVSVTAGEFVICAIGSTSVPTNTLTCSDTDGDSFNYPTSNPYLDSGVNIGGLGWATMSHTNASEVITLTVTNNVNNMCGGASVYSGTPTSGWDVALAGNNNGSTSSPVSGTSSSTARASELGASIFVINPGNSSPYTFAGANGWTVEWSYAGTSTSNNACVYADQVLTSTGTQQAAITIVTQGPQTSGLGAVSSIK